MRVGSLFSGVGGFDRGLERAGHEIVWQVEWDKQARSVLRRHWPDVDLYEDVCDVGYGGGALDKQLEEPAGGVSGPYRSGHRADDVARTRTALAPVDLVCGGFPCQDLSVAGRRAGLDGARSGLWFEFYRIVAELAPVWVLIENVPGLLSSDEGRDMAVIVRGLAQLGYVGAWRVLDSQYLGVAQRRRRIFLLACRDPRAGCPAEVLALAEGVSGHPAPGREAGAGVAGTLEARAATGGYDPGAHGAASGHVQVAHTLRAEGFDASEDGTGRGTPLVAQSLAIRGRDGVPQAELGDDGKANALVTPNGGRGGVGSGAVLAFDTTQITSSENRNNPKPGDPCHPLAAGAHPPSITGAVPRRLTPVECERLQGFPDDWTRWADDGSEIADGPRYRMMGNAVTVNVAEWIGRRLTAACRGA